MDEKYMKLALELALKGEGRVSPNPMVGAVIVKNNKIIGKGYHGFYGGPHAEVNAITNASESVEGSTIYVTLEPCCHYGKTPPCVNLIMEKKIKKVIIACLDPNPLVAGKGVKILEDNGIEVVSGILEKECSDANEIFMKYIVHKKPFVIMKSAMTLDGKIATYSGDSKWITSEESRLEVHKLRNKVSAIMVGIGTVLVDNPSLTCRIEGGKSPTRIIIDSSLRIPMDSNVLHIKDNTKTIIITTEKGDKKKIEELKKLGVDIIITPLKNHRVDLSALMEILGDMKIDSILLEGGSTLNYSALNEGIVDKIQFYIAPKIVGGESSKTPVGGEGKKYISDGYQINNLKVRTIGSDTIIEGYVKREEHKGCLLD